MIKVYVLNIHRKSSSKLLCFKKKIHKKNSTIAQETETHAEIKKG